MEINEIKNFMQKEITKYDWYGYKLSLVSADTMGKAAEKSISVYEALMQYNEFVKENLSQIMGAVFPESGRILFVPENIIKAFTLYDLSNTGLDERKMVKYVIWHEHRHAQQIEYAGRKSIKSILRMLMKEEKENYGNGKMESDANSILPYMLNQTDIAPKSVEEVFKEYVDQL